MDTRPFLLHLAAALVAACGGNAGPEVVVTPFACGPDMVTCQPGTFCLSVANYAMPTYYDCSTFPPSCSSTPTCECLMSGAETHLGCSLDTCMADPDGHVMASCTIG